MTKSDLEPGRREIEGDILSMTSDFDVIVQGCNCQRVMGAGLALQVKQREPGAYLADLAPGKRSLGTFTEYQTEGGAVIVNAYTQFYPRPPISLDAIDLVFRSIADKWGPSAKIAYPMIGAGLGGGNWAIIQTIIDEALKDNSHTLVRYKQ